MVGSALPTLSGRTSSPQHPAAEREGGTMKLSREAIAVTCTTAVLFTYVQASPAQAAVSTTVQHCSTSKVTCIDQTVDNNGEICAVVKQDASHKANMCVWDHDWLNFITGPNINGRVETCVSQCYGVDHFHWANNQITLWRLNDDGSYTALRAGSPDIPGPGDTGPTTTVYATNVYQWGLETSKCAPGPSIKTQTEVQVKVYWKGGTNTSVLTFNSANFCHT
jgi:hypothetical protein